MKKLIYIVSFLCLSASCTAQQKLQEGRFNVEGKTLIVKRIKNVLHNKEFYSVRFETEYDNKPYPAPKKPNAYPVLREDIHFDMDKLKTLIGAIVGDRKHIVAKNNGSLNLSIMFKQNGSILNISYRLHDLPLSLKEIARLDKQLKKEIKATFTGREYVDYYVIYCPNIKITF